ncbi:hypothetical protein AB0D78_06795 [Streptomyces avermitilis]|uniref:hypothetical protein n=1 Tax=Streptomyces avermitilis TaxID=33903 RepID=UPI0033F0639A
MSHRIARLFEPLLRLLLPGTGRRRRAVTATAPAHRRSTPSYAPGQTARRAGSRPLRGEDNAMVRPYLVAPERSEEARRQRARRRALWLAVHGIDIGPRIIHGIEIGPRIIHGVEVTA